MADDKKPDSADESVESTPAPNDPTDQRQPVEEAPAELSGDSEIVDPEDTPDDEYVDDPDTPDINEAKLDRATDEAAEESTADPGSVAQRRPRSTRPVRRSASGGAAKAPVAERDEAAEDAESGAAETVSSKEVARKDRATRTRRSAERERAAGSERTTPAAFVRESTTELRKVVWPTGTQVQQYFVVVLVFVLFIIAFVSLLDLGFGWLVLKAFG
ncbi:preprotein translocase subunit SecE [Naumannella sp. ID2617S]|nr:preprotein translocase subunit SecE [Naumannella sp. ID2617S]